MKKTIGLFLVAVLPLLAISQDNGIHFEHGLTWQQVKAKAKAEKKYIFIDCFTTWCGPCRAMSNKIFPQKEAGDFFNKNFINIKVQLDTTANDNESVKAWYKDGSEIAREYGVNFFPTFLFFGPDGEAVHRITGASPTAAEFVADASEALDPSKQYYTLVKKYKSGSKDPELLKSMAMLMLKSGNDSAAMRITSEYLATQKNMLTKDNIGLITLFARNSGGNGFKFFLNNSRSIDSVMGSTDYSMQILAPIILVEEFNKMAGADQSGAPDWDALKTSIVNDYPQIAARADEMIIAGRTDYYSNTGDWKNFVLAAGDYVKLGDKTSPEKLNMLAWAVFQGCSDTSYLAEALGWSKLSLEKSNDPLLMDTYANILYKLGKKEDALALEEKATALAGSATRSTLEETLGKMKNGEKTWPY